MYTLLHLPIRIAGIIEIYVGLEVVTHCRPTMNSPFVFFLWVRSFLNTIMAIPLSGLLNDTDIRIALSGP